MAMHPEFRALWKRAGYSEKCASAEVVPPPASTFRRVYHMASAKHGQSALSLGRMKVARVMDLNDPFELLGVNFRSRDSLLAETVSEFKKTYDRHAGLLCFSSDWLSPVLWSHYADRHKGICLGFDVPIELLEKVKYEHERIATALGEDTNPAALSEGFQKLLRCTKYRHWEYEEEWRAFVDLAKAMADGGLHFWPFGRDLQLLEVILGEQCVLALDEVRQLVQTKFPQATVCRARLATKFFSVVPDEDTVP
jgi:hypothetical protein